MTLCAQLPVMVRNALTLAGLVGERYPDTPSMKPLVAPVARDSWDKGTCCAHPSEDAEKYQRRTLDPTSTLDPTHEHHRSSSVHRLT